MNTQQLVERLERLAPRDGTPDWADVLERASLADTSAAPSSFVRRRRAGGGLSRTRSRLAIVGAAVLILVFAAALAPGWLGSKSEDALLQKALAAIPAGPVLHVVLEFPQARAGSSNNRTFQVVDLRTGRTRPVMHTLELWWDRQRHIVHAVDKVDGTIGFDELATAHGFQALQPSGQVRSFSWPKRSLGTGDLPAPLNAFFAGYKHALATHQAQRAGSGRVGGHEVEWLRFRTPKPSGKGRNASSSEEVAVDKHTFKAVAIREPRCGRCTNSFFVEIIKVLESASGTEANFAPPVASPQRPVAQYGATKRTGTPGAASGFLHREAVWAGRRVGRIAFTRVVFAHSLNFSSRQLHPPAKDVIARGRGITFYYGTSGNYVSIAETADTGLSFPSFNMETLSPHGHPLTAAGTTLPREGEMILSHIDGGSWIGQLRKAGLQVEIEATTRVGVLSVARALKPTP